MFSFLLGVMLLANSGPGLPVKIVAKADGINKTVLLQLVNAYRKQGCKCGDTKYPEVPALSWNNQLETAAIKHSADMQRNNYFNHIDKDGNRGGQRITAAGYTWKAFGENIAMGYDTEAEVVAGWMKSPGHCKNIMSKDFTEMGIGKSGKYWTQTFGKR